jgi:hypothetical protein
LTFIEKEVDLRAKLNTQYGLDEKKNQTDPSAEAGNSV